MGGGGGRGILCYLPNRGNQKEKDEIGKGKTIPVPNRVPDKSGY